MKALNWIAWISGGIGLVIVLLGLIQLVFEKFIQGSELINYFHSGNSFFLITIALFVYVYRCQCKKE
jgi:cytosine/uracil/thiamine/allantoin permease